MNSCLPDARVRPHRWARGTDDVMTSRSKPTPLALRDPASLTLDERARRRARLRLVHLETGIDPRYLSMPEGSTLWFVTVSIDVAIHMPGQGLTNLLHEYALGAHEGEAIEAVCAWLHAAAPETSVLRSRAVRAGPSHPEELCFPEQVRRLDMPARARIPPGVV